MEYKSWHNLHNPEDRAELARDITALANHGGGRLIDGFHQEARVPENTHLFWTNCSPEPVAGIVRACPDPPVHCEVETQHSAEGTPIR